MPEDIRIDKWLWAVRVFKTRSQATEACKKSKVIINNITVKPSHIVKIGEVIQVKKMPVTYSYKVKSILNNRVSAKFVPDYLEDLTPKEELDKLINNNSSGFFVRDRGSGRPTKKERRLMDDIRNSHFYENKLNDY